MDRFDLIVTLGQRESGLRKVVVPADLVPVVCALTQPESWPSRLKRAAEIREGSSAQESADPAELWADIGDFTTSEISDRGKLKLAKVARTLAQLLGEPRSVNHFRLALLIRQDLDGLLRQEQSGAVGKFNQNT